MATGATLGELLTAVRAELLQSVSSLQNRNADPAYREILQRVQRQLWSDFAWPHLRARRDIAMAAGQRYYDFPDDLALDRVETVEVKWSGRWHPVARGIGQEHYNSHDSDEDVRADPVLRWAPYEGGQFEVWPIPTADGLQTLRFVGIKRLSPLVETDDTCDLDRDLLVLMAAAEIAAENKSPRAEALARRARRHYDVLKGRSEAGGSPLFVLGGGYDPLNGRATRRAQPPLVAVDRGNN